MSNIFCHNQNWFRCKIQYKIPQCVSLLLLSDDIWFDSLRNNEKKILRNNYDDKTKFEITIYFLFSVAYFKEQRKEKTACVIIKIKILEKNVFY
jgi:hypothetical protein